MAVGLSLLQMVDRAVAGAEAGGGADGVLQIMPRAADGVGQGHALGEAGGDGRGQGAAGAVGVFACAAGAAKWSRRRLAVTR